jgi:hypothetical protein
MNHFGLEPKGDIHPHQVHAEQVPNLAKKAKTLSE